MDSFKADSPRETRPIEISEEEMQTVLFKSAFMTRTRTERREMDEKNFIIQFVLKLSNTITKKNKLVMKPIDMSALIKTITEKTAGKLPAELPTSIDRVVKSVFQGLQKMYNSEDLLQFVIAFHQSIFEANVTRILISEINKVKKKRIKCSVFGENQTSPAETSEEQIPFFVSSPGERTQETKERNFIIKFLVRLINMTTSKTGTSTKQVNTFAILENVVEMAVGKLPAQLPKSLDKLVRAVYKSLKKTYKSKMMVQTAMEFRQLNFEDNVARTLISEASKMKEKRIKVFVVVTENNNNSSEQSSSKTFRKCCPFGQFLKTLFSYKIVVEIRL